MTLHVHYNVSMNVQFIGCTVIFEASSNEGKGSHKGANNSFQ